MQNDEMYIIGFLRMVGFCTYCTCRRRHQRRHVALLIKCMRICIAPIDVISIRIAIGLASAHCRPKSATQYLCLRLLATRMPPQACGLQIAFAGRLHGYLWETAPIDLPHFECEGYGQDCSCVRAWAHMNEHGRDKALATRRQQRHFTA